MAVDDATLIRIAVFGLTMSIIATVMIAALISPNNDYDYDEITAYRNELISFSGNSMVNNTPWVLTACYTPWMPSDGVNGHLTDDGWLYGQSIAYSEIGKSADIRLDPNQKSSSLLSNGQYEYRYQTGKEWWAGGNQWGITLLNDSITGFFGVDSNTYAQGTANNYSYTGVRYVFDPTLPFSNGTSSVDGSLSLVWYSFDGEEGLSGGLDIYNKDVILASYSASNIVQGYESTGGYACVYDFDFDGTHLNLSIKFDPDKTNAGYTLMECWTLGYWTMAISSVSAGNFYDIENSTAFVSTAGSLIDTFISIFTFSMPSIDNAWMDLILWLLVVLPMTIAMGCVTMHFVQSIKIL